MPSGPAVRARAAALPAVFLAGAVLAAGTALPPPGDPHLPSVPRTAEEAARVAAVAALAEDFGAPEAHEALPGGGASLRADKGRDSFSQPSAGLSATALADFTLGNVLFRKLWVAAPSTVKGSDGLGPLYNARSCEACHRRDGRGLLPGEGGRTAGLVLKLAPPDPAYGQQLQDAAAPGQRAEGRTAVSYTREPVELADGTVVALRKPVYGIADPASGAPAEGLVLSPRLAPPMTGLGLIEAVPVEDILADADPLDADGDGISGRPNVVPSGEFGAPMLGRFGWKAGQPTIRAQAAAALSADMGLSNPLLPAPWGDCTEAQAACRAAPHGQDAGLRDGLEVDGESLDLLAHYARNLAVPQRRDLDAPEVLAGKHIFYEAGCPACHRPKFVTARLPDRPEQSFQLIWPYSDFLLHDMGAGLADGYAEGLATGREWRTPPLWGIGLTATVSGRSAFLHDGRARTLLEALLWHGGEAQAARDRVVGLTATDRDALLTFLESL